MVKDKLEQELMRAILEDPFDELARSAWLDYREERGDRLKVARSGKKRVRWSYKLNATAAYRYGLLFGVWYRYSALFLLCPASLFRQPVVFVSLPSPTIRRLHCPAWLDSVRGYSDLSINSALCVEYGRKLAGLPPLDPKKLLNQSIV